LVSAALSDTLFVCPIRKYSKEAIGNNNIYIYYWDNPWSGGSTDGVGRICGDTSCHTTDMVFLFNPVEDPGSESKSNHFRDYLKSFLAQSAPGIVDGIEWEKLERINPKFLTIPRNTINSNHNIMVEGFPDNIKCDYWDQDSYFFETSPKPKAPLTGVSPFLFLSILILYLAMFGIQVIFLIITRFRRTQLEYNITKMRDSSKEIYEIENQRSGKGQFEPTPVMVRIDKVSYSIKPNKNQNSIQLLKECTAEFSSGSMTALMGPSGSGKTTLLSIVNNS
jgi:hypothetical protein